MNKALRKIPYALLFVAIICFTAQRASASHAMASDLTYKCLGGNTYQLTLTFYRDCAGIAAPFTPVINIKSATCNQNISLTLSEVPGTGQEVTPKCSSTVTTCQGGTAIGVQEWVYTGIVTLPMHCTDWTFSYTVCCRNAIISTINNPTTSDIYIAATLNNTIDSCVNSPVFSTKPVPFVCVGQQFCFSQGATDSDGDSLAYQLITPLTSAATTVNYMFPYNATEPLNSSPPLALNSASGEICMTPQLIQVTVMAVMVKAYRNGVLIGSVERDMQVIVMNCNNNLPWLSGINGSSVFNMSVCAGAPFCFDILSNDIDTGQTLTITNTNTIAGSTFSSAGNPHPTSNFCWTPADSQISPIPYCFTATATDNACPFNGSQTFTYCITVGGITVNLGPDQQISCSDLATIYATVSTPGPVSYLWNTGATTTYITTGPGTYWCTVSNGTCTASDTVVITSPFVPVAAFTNTIPFCANQPVNFTDHSTTSGGTIVYWQWNFGDGSPTSNTQNPTHTYTDTGTYSVQLIVANNLGCMDTIVHTITILPPPTAAFTYVNACQGQSVTFTNQSTGGATLWHWSFGDGQTSTLQNPTHTYSSPGTYTITLIAGSGSACADTVSQSITTFPSPIANFTATPVCSGDTMTFTNTTTGATSWHWNFGDGNSSTVQNPTHIYGGTGSYNVTLIVTSTNGCIDTIVKPVTVNPLPVANAGPDVAICSGKTTTLTASGGGTYLWSPGGSVNNTYTVIPMVTTTYTVTVTNGNGCTAADTVTVTVNALPVANAGPDIDICKGSSGTLTASGGGSYVWEPGGNNTATITVSPTINTTYTVTVTNAGGCTATATATVNVHQPVINLAAAFICSGDSTTLNAGVTGLTYIWSTGDTTQSIYITGAGTYTVTGTDAFGCSATASSAVSVGVATPISLSNAVLCQGQTVTFDAGNPGGTYIWSPNGETTQTIVTGIAGTYSVTATNANGCKTGASATVTVNPLPVASAGAGQSICNGATVTLTASGGSAYQWNPGGTFNQTINVNPATSTTFTVTVTNAFGCTATASVNVQVNPVPVVSIPPTAICAGASTTLNAGNPGCTYLWTPNGETTQSISVSTVGNYGVTVATSFGCSSSDSTTVAAGSSVTGNPIVVTFCPGQSAVVDAGNFGVSYLWSTGAITQTISVSVSGTYSVTITNSGGCTATIVDTVNQNPAPVVQFVSSPDCFGNATQFTDQSTVSSGTLTSWNWAFGDGQSSVIQNPAHSYTSAGVFNVTLVVNDSNGCSASAVQPVTINPLPVASFSTNAVCSGDASIFNDLSHTAGGTIVSWNWTFGDGQNAVIQNPQHIYASPGTYNVILVVSSNSGCIDTVSAPVVVNELPIPAFSASGVCASTAAAFTNTSSIGSGSIASYSWNFGDGSNSASANPQHIYNASGTYNVVMIATSDHGCKDTVSHTIDVFPAPTADFTGTDVCLNNATAFSNLSTVNGGAGFTSGWNFGDSSTSALLSPTHTYSTGGTFTVSLTVTSDSGCSISITKQVQVYLPPIAAFASGNVCLRAPSVFNDQSTSQSGSIVSWNWNFGDSTTANLQQVTHTYKESGEYNVSLSVTTNYGCSNASNDSLNIYPLTAPAISAPGVCEGSPISFTNIGDTAGSLVTGLLWSFGDGMTSDSVITQHTYATYGTYDVTLKTTNQFGCSDTVVTPVHVYPNPVMSFTAGNACFGVPVSFGNESNIPSGQIVSYSWDFGDSLGYSTLADPIYRYPMAGSYTVSLSAVSDHGCPARTQNPLTMYPDPIVNFNGVSTGCGPINAVFTDATTIAGGSINGWLWDFGDGYVSTDSTPSHIYSNPGTYVVTLTVSSDKGCVASGQSSEQEVVLPAAKAEFTMDPTTIDILNPVVHFTNLSTDCNTYNWKFGDGDSSTVFSPIHIYKDPGDYTVVLVVNNTYNCPGTAMRIMNNEPISKLFAPNAFTPNEDGVNDVWQPKYTDMTDIKVWIFDRWGEMIKTWDGLDGYWDGTYKGNPAPINVYVYQIQGTGADGKLYNWTGDITLVR